MEIKDTDTQDMMENAVNSGIAFEEPEIEGPIGFELPEDEAAEDEAATLRRRPRRDLEEILAVHDPEEALKAERVQEALRPMPEWELTLDGQSITRVKELPAPEVATLYTAYVTGFAGFLGLPVAVSVLDGLVLVTLYAPRVGDCMGGLTGPVLDFARQIG